jgi:arylsulfatase A-like enzyme
MSPTLTHPPTMLAMGALLVASLPLPLSAFSRPDSAMSTNSRTASSSSSPSQPNFIIICADDLGFGDLGCYGAKAIPTPNLDRMASEGVRFTQFYATAATCTPSRYSLLTGSYPWRNPRAKILAGDAPMIIGTDELTLPAALKRSGYSTSVIGKWHIGLGDGTIDWNGDIRPTPLDVGFDESFIMAATNDRVPCVYVKGRRVVNLDPKDPLEVVYAKKNPFPEVPTGRTHPELLTMPHSDEQHFDTIVNGVPRIGFSRGGKSATWDDTTMTDVFLEQTKDFLTRKKDSPFFLYLAMQQPHVPRIPSKRFAGLSDKGPRGDVIMELDWAVGQVLDHLIKQGLDKSTIVVFTSDNGPILNDGYKDQSAERTGAHRPAGPLRGGKYSLFDGGTRVPTIVWAPGRAQTGESDALLSQVDFFASFARLAGKDLAPSESADSLPLADAILGQSKQGRDHLVTEGFGAKTLVRQGWWILIPSYPGKPLFGDKNMESGNSNEIQLYDLSTDIGQRKNLASAQPERVEAMSELLSAIRERRGFPVPQ